MSRNYHKVKGYYESDLWSRKMVRNAVGRWITKEEYKLITGEDY